MTRTLAVPVAVALLFSGTPGASLAPISSEEPGLAAGIRQVDEGDFEGAVATLGPVVERLRKKGGHDAAQACLYLGIAELALGQRDDARARFREALGHDPSLRPGPDRFSPKVISTFEEARREREAAARAAKPGGRAEAGGGKGGAGRMVLVAGAAAAAGVGIALAAGGGGPTSSGGAVTLTGARFATPVLDCPNGSDGVLLALAIDVNVQNTAERDAAIGALATVLTIVASPGLPGEVGYQSSQPATFAPTALRPGAAVLRVQTSLVCGNASGDVYRFNDWKGRVTFSTSDGNHTIETVDTMRVNIP